MILEKIANHSRRRVAKAKEHVSLETIKNQAKDLEKGTFRFEKALQGPSLAFICEVKKASPSKGVISEDFPYLDIAKSYEKSGAEAISVLTEDKYFLGSDEIFKEIRQSVDIPMLRKDFTVDEYQIYEAKVMGADAVLIIVSLLDQNLQGLKNYLAICEDLGISALVETHNADEIDLALEAGARMIGVNNRNLRDFTVDFSNASKLRKEVPEDVIFIAESGLTNNENAKEIAQMGANAALVGEALMRSDNPKATLEGFRMATRL